MARQGGSMRWRLSMSKGGDDGRANAARLRSRGLEAVQTQKEFQFRVSDKMYR
jgi:hypothetical protein